MNLKNCQVNYAENNIFIVIDLLDVEVKLILEKVIENECLLILNKLQEDSRFFAWWENEVCWWKRLQIKWIITEHSEVLLKISEKSEEIKEMLMNFDNELKKANLADENDDTLFKQNEKFEVLKIEIKQALQHLKLTEVLSDRETFCGKIDEIEKEYRDFHDQNISLLKGHPSFINVLSLIFEKTISEVFKWFPEKEGIRRKILKELLKNWKVNE